MSQYNLRNRAVKRLMKEAEELRHATDEYHAQPVEDNLFEWHFTLRGPPNSDYDGGIYHGRITLPPDYPMKPPSIILLTPNGRFEVNKKICLSISGHHPETWQPSWSIRTALLAIIGFMPTHGNGAIGSLDYTKEERQALARRSQDWHCPECGNIKDIFCKKAYRLEEEVPSTEPLIDTEAKQNESVEEVPDNTPQFSPENNIPSSEEDPTLKHRFKSESAENTNSQMQKENTRVNTENNNSNFLTYVIYVIVTIIVFLCLRRLFSL